MDISFKMSSVTDNKSINNLVHRLSLHCLALSLGESLVAAGHPGCGWGGRVFRLLLWETWWVSKP